jgi:ABC-type glycerol-3-phosphate transport system substrate-binding protein
MIIFLFAGVGCKGLSETEQQAIRPVTLDYWTVYNDVGQLRALAAEYKKIRPYVTVRVRQIRFDEMEDRFVNALADDVAPDIFSIPVQEIGKYQPRLSSMPSSVKVARVYEKGTYQKETVVEQYSEAMPTIRNIEDNYVATVVDDVVIGNKVYGLPLSLDTMVIYYNRELLDLSGIAEPPTTWIEFMDAVKQSTRIDADGNIIQSGVAMGTAENISNAPDILALLMMQNRLNVAHGGAVDFARGVDKLTNTHPAVQSLRFYTDFANKEKEVYSWNNTLEDSLDSFVRGKSVFYFGFARDYSRIRSLARSMNVEILQVPQLNPTTPANVASYWVESVVAKSSYKDLAWDFVRFISTERSIRNYTRGAKLPSPLRVHVKLYEDDEFLGPFMSQVLYARTWYNGGDASVANRAMAGLIESYLLPPRAKEKLLERDARILTYASRLIQQTQ